VYWCWPSGSFVAESSAAPLDGGGWLSIHFTRKNLSPPHTPRDDLSSKVDDSSPEVDDLPSKVDEASRGVDGLPPKVDEASPEVDEASPEVGELSPKVDEASREVRRLGETSPPRPPSP